MSDENLPSLLTLPVEILHYIFDYLDTQTILFSIRYVCTQLRTITNTYKNYVLDLRLISKPNFHRVCNIIRPENVVSLNLSDSEETPGQIDLFLSLFNIRHFTRLRLLALFLINDDNLDTILKHATHCSLSYFSIERPRSQTHRSTTFHLLSSIMAQRTLRNFTCTIDLLSRDNLTWPLYSTLEHLTIDRCTNKQFYNILSHLPHLRAIVLHSFNLDIYDNCKYPSTQYLQLTSLSMKQGFLSMDKIESFLSLMPSLVKLQLEGSADDAIFDGSRWEMLIRTKMPSLTQFKFFFRSQNRSVIELSAAGFRTPFWSNEKHWLVHCIYDIPMEEILLCLVPGSITKLTYNFVGPVIVSTIIQNNTTIMIHDEQYNRSFFQRITELELSEYALDSLNNLSTLIDLSQVMKLKIQFTDPEKFVLKLQQQLINLLKESKNVHSLEISFEYSYKMIPSLIENICSAVPCHVKHLNLEVKTLADINLVLERLKHLSSVTFRRLPSSLLYVENLIQWHTQLKRNIIYRQRQGSLHLWLDTPIRKILDDETRHTDER